MPGREVVNKEPPVSRYVVEKLYRVHRERVMKVETTIDTHIVIPDFLLNREWKKNSEKQKQKVVLQENQEIYKRIAKLEDSEGHISKENKEHRKRMTAKLDYLRKLKEHGRLVSLIKIQKENEYMLKRLEKAKPQYTLKKCKDWYKHHELYKMGRRSDPTAGHIMHGMGELLPSSLPPLSTVTTKLDDETLTTLLDSKRVKRKNLPSLALSQSSASPSLATNSVLSLSSADRRNSSFSKSAPSLVTSESNVVSTRKFSQHQVSRKESRVLNLIEEVEEIDSPKKVSGSVSVSDSHRHLDTRLSCRSFDGSEDGNSETDFSLALNPFNHEVEMSPQHVVHLDDMIMLASRPFPLPAESKNCLVQIYCSREYDENLRIVVVPPGAGSGLEKLAERVITIDHAYDLVHASGHSSQLMHSTEQDDLQTLSDFLINMFKEADIDASGSLTFDEFQVLMEQVELGISPQELRFVISEADENENGVVDYEEFVPLAVDLIQSFRARNRAKTISSQQDVLVDDQILQTISSSELDLASKVCLEKLMEYDKKNYGLIRVSEFKRCLSSIAPSVGLLESEINLLSQLLPRDQFNRLKYNSTPTSFFEHLSKVRFMTMKNAMIESQGSGLQKYLLELCKDEEKKNDEENMKNSRGGDQKGAPPGYIPCRSLISILTNSPRLSLSRLQVLVIMSEASVLDGHINYYQFIPIVTKAIELMFEPKALRQRAELIARTDLSPEALLQGMGMSQDAFEDRLLTLFKSYDIDHNGTLDQNEFIACLESLELQLTKGEMVALMASADVAQHGFLGFEDFVKFFSHNLLHLEREKRIRLLQSSMDMQHHGQGDSQDGSTVDENSTLAGNGSSHHSSGLQQLDLGQQLLSIFELSDPNRTGFITYEDFESILRDFSMHSSPFLMDLLRSELHTSTVDTGSSQGDKLVLVEYAKSLATCADLFSVYRAKESAWIEHHVKEEEAEKKAQQIARTQIADIQRVCRYLLRRMRATIPTKVTDFQESSSVLSADSHTAVESTVFLLSKGAYADVQAVVRAPQAGLSRSEANIVLHRLLGSVFGTTSSDSADINGTPKHLQHSITDRAVSLDRGASAGPPAVSPLTHKTLSAQESQSSHPQQLLQISSKDVFDAVFEARKTTIMRTLLQPIDQSQLHSRIFQALEAVWLEDHQPEKKELLDPKIDNSSGSDSDNVDDDPSAPRDVYGHLLPSAKTHKRRQQHKKTTRSSQSAGGGKYLSVDRCYSALESMSGLPVSRAQLMFVIAAADCYDKASGSLLDIYKLSEHIGQIFGQLVGAENIATRGAVVTQGKVDDRKALHGLKDTQLLRHLMRQLMPIDGSDENDAAMKMTFTVSQLCQVLRDTQRLQLTDRDLNTILAVCGLLNCPKDEPLYISMQEGNTSNSSSNITAEKLLAGVVDCIVALCRERMIHRRLSLCHPAHPAAGSVNGVSATAGEVSVTLNEDSRKTLKQLADKLLYVVKLHLSDSVSQEDARRFSGLDTAEYFYPLRVGLPGDAKLLRQSNAAEDSSSPLFAGPRRHHHLLHRLQNRGSSDHNKERSKHQRGLSLSASETVGAVTITDANEMILISSQLKTRTLDTEGDEDVNSECRMVNLQLPPTTLASVSKTVAFAETLQTEMGSTFKYEDDFEDDPEIALLVLFKGAVFLPAKIPLPPNPTVAGGAKSAGLSRKTSTENVISISSSSSSAVAAVVGGTSSSPLIIGGVSVAAGELNLLSGSTDADETRPNSSFPRKLYQQVQQSNSTRTAASSGSNSSTSASAAHHNNPLQIQYRTVRKGVMLQIVAVDHGGGLSLYSTQGSGLVAQAISADGSVTVPCANLPLRLPSVGAVDKDAAEQFVANILDRLYLEQSVPPHIMQQHLQQQQQQQQQTTLVAAKHPPHLRTTSTFNVSSSSQAAAAASVADTGITWSLKLLDDEEV